MNPDKERQRDNILETALSLDRGSRSEFLERACEDHPDLRAEIEHLLGLGSQMDTDFLERPAGQLEAQEQSSAEQSETRTDLRRDELKLEALYGETAREIADKQKSPGFKPTNSTHRDIEASGRFKITRQLGIGAFGIVYEVYDHHHRETIALKVLRDIDPFLLYRFKQEFRVIHDLQHPNVLRVFELIQHETSIFFTMELIRGVNLIDYIRRPGGTHFEEARLRSALPQLASAVRALHASKLIHRDIKPRNILVDSSGHLTLLDFGLIKFFGPESGVETMVAGTPYYMAPEQANGEILTEAVDWYGFGVVVYEALTGRAPFEGSARVVLERKKQEAVIPPADLVGHVPTDLSDLSVDLLNVDPAKRPSGLEVMARLTAKEASTAIPTSAQDVFVGRSDILDELSTLMRVSASGALSIATVSGPSGIGKTALIDAFAREVKKNHPYAFMLRGRCLETEFLPFGAVDDLVDQLSRKLLEMPPAKVSAVLPRENTYLVRVFPVLGQVEAIRRRVDEESVEIANPQELRRRGFAALTELFARLSDLFPLVAIIDDMQWADLDTIPLFKQLVSGPIPPRMLLLCSFRTDNLNADPLAPALQQVVKEAPIAVTRVFELTELNANEALSLASHLLNGKGGNGIAEVITSDSGGNPLFIVQLAAALNSADFKDFVPNSAHVSSFASLIQHRVLALPPLARRVLQLLAIAGSPISEPLLFSLLGTDSDRLFEFNRLISERLIRRLNVGASRKIELYHARIRDSILEMLREDERQGMHRELAQALENDPQSDPAFVFHHFQMAGMNDHGVRYAREAGDNAARGLAFDRAAQCYLSCLELQQPGPDDRRDLTLKLADALVNAGRGIEAATYYLEAAELFRGEEAIRLRRRAADQLIRSGDIVKGEAILKRLGEAFSLSIEPSLSSALLRAGVARLLIRIRGVKFRERVQSEIDPEVLARLETYWSISMVLSIFSPIAAMSFQFRHLSLALRSGAQRHLAMALATEAAQLTMTGPNALPRAEPLLKRAFDIAARINDDYLFGFVGIMSTLISWLTGNWPQTADQATAAEKILAERCTGVASELGTARLLNIGALIWMGEWTRFPPLLSSYIEEAEQRHDLYTTAILQQQLWMSHLAVDDVASARSTLNRAQRILEGRWTPRGFHLTHLWTLIGGAHILLYEGRGVEASALLESDWRSISRSFLLHVQMLRVWMQYLRGACAIAAALEDHRKANLLSIASDSFDHIRRAGTPFAKALALLLDGLRFAGQGRTESAAQSFEEAEVALDSLAMAMFAAAARYARGLLIGGAKGQQLKNDSESRMLKLGVRRPERIAHMLCPVL